MCATQVDACGFREIGYHHIVPLESNSAGMAALSMHLGMGERIQLAHRHSVRVRQKASFGQHVLGNLRRAFADDIKLLNYPNTSTW
mmetsp:Transcript_56098/g.128802  ORF Transcript_56098/g.128802 Transcript_56098/m.128802 type:complete len:86 (+) Transcript_56098:164-421(+)